MGWWRGEYTDREWLQMAACLLGPPLMALLTAYFTKELYPRRNFVHCMVGGLIASGIVALTISAPFGLWVLISGRSGSAKFLHLFDHEFGWGLAIVAIGAAAVGVRVAAHTERTTDGEHRPGGTLNLRQLFLLQLLPFVVLGCWLGMRSAALNLSPGLERAQRKWSSRGWQVHTDEKQELLALARSQPYHVLDEAIENLNLRDAAREPWVKELRFGVASDPTAIDLAGFRGHPRLTNLYMTYAYGSSLSTKHLQEIAGLPSLEFLSLRSSGSFCDNLAPLASLTKLKRLALSTFTIDPKALSGLKSCKTLKVLTLDELTPTSLAPIEFPESLEELKLNSRFLWTPSVENFRAMKELRQLTLMVSDANRIELAAIASAPSLEKLVLGSVNAPAELEVLLASPTLRSLQFSFRPQGEAQELALVDALEKLAAHPTLKQLACNSSLFVMPSWGGMGAGPPPVLSSSATNAGAFMGPGAIGGVGGPVNLPLNHIFVERIQTRVAAIRQELGLPPLELQLQSDGPFGIGGPPLPREANVKPNVQGGRP